MRKRKIDHDKSNGICECLFSPSSDWVAPREFPNLNGIKTIGLDTETRDPELITRGPGFLRGDADVVGISVATSDSAWYFPFGHLSGGNMSRDSVIRFISDAVAVQDRFIVGANLQYELEGLDSLGINVRGKLIDVQVAEALIDEEQETYRLESIANKYLKIGKDETLLREAAAAHGIDPKKSLWKLHSKYVGPYAEWDAQAPLKIFQEQLKELKLQDLESVFQLESELLPLLFQMRKQGVPVDLEAAGQLSATLKGEEDKLRLEFRKSWGQDLDEWSGPQIAMLCDKHQVRYPRTSVGNPSFTADYLENSDHALLTDISEIRKISKFRQTFVNDWILKWHIRGRIHPQWRQVARDEGGTRTGRMAASCPNPQQIPAGKFRKTGKPSPVGKAIRSLFISDTGNWGKLDYSQQEPRVLTHYAAECGCTGAAIARMAYKTDPDMDFYNYMVEAAGIDRRPAKDMYLGRCYGMGIKKMAIKLNRTEDEARKVLATFDERVPFVKEIADQCTNAANKRGYIKTLLGRRRHFNFWEPSEYGKLQFGESPLPRELAERKWGDRIKRSNTHKALNALIQGSAADMTKAALLKIWREGKVIPYFQVHDEIDFPAVDEEHAKQCQVLAETCVEMTVPVKADLDYGKAWK